MTRVYLDWNATAPLRPEARAAMLAAMDVVGNPSSVHAEGREAKAIVEKARGQVAALVGCAPSEIVFTSGATEAMALAVSADMTERVAASDFEHDCVRAYRKIDLRLDPNIPDIDEYAEEFASHIILELGPRDRVAIQTANSETGVMIDVGALFAAIREPLKVARKYGTAGPVRLLSDIVQSVGKTAVDFSALGSHMALVSGHKIGGPSGTGALITKVDDQELWPLQRGGGQEMGRRSGTENVIGIAGFGAAAEAAQQDLESGVWTAVERLRDGLESRLEAEVEEITIIGRDGPRLPNTSCFAVPGWKGETQVMQMDLAGYAVSAGSACSSGKVKESRVLRAMGYDAETASSAIRVSIGPTTTEAEVMGFAEVWLEHYRRWKQRAA